MPKDLMDWVNAVFPGDEALAALAELDGAVDHTGAPVDERLLRSAALGSRGKLKELKDMVALLKVDWRDVIVAGEYEVSNKKLMRVRDLTKPIPGPDDLRGMNVTERLLASGLFPEFERGVRAGSVDAVVAVLRRTFLTGEQARETAAAAISNPSNYGF